MNLVRMAAAGRPVRIGTRLLLLSPPSMRGLGNLFAFLGSVIPEPEDAPPDWLPELMGEPAIDQWKTAAGAMVLLYETTRRDHPTLTIEECAAIAASLDPASTAALVNAAFVRGKSVPDPRRKSRRASGGRSGGLESIDFGPIFECESLGRFSPQTLADMSVDQFENALARGQLDPPDKLSLDDVVAIYEAEQAKIRRRKADEAARAEEANPDVHAVPSKPADLSADNPPANPPETAPPESN